MHRAEAICSGYVVPSKHLLPNDLLDGGLAKPRAASVANVHGGDARQAVAQLVGEMKGHGRVRP